MSIFQVKFPLEPKITISFIYYFFFFAVINALKEIEYFEI